MLKFSFMLFIDSTTKVWYLSGLSFLKNVLCLHHHVLIYLCKYTRYLVRNTLLCEVFIWGEGMISKLRLLRWLILQFDLDIWSVKLLTILWLIGIVLLLDRFDLGLQKVYVFYFWHASCFMIPAYIGLTYLLNSLLRFEIRHNK